MLVDIAAIPLDDVLKTATRLNKELALLGKDDIELGGDQIPHVSLLIIDVDQEQVAALQQTVQRKFRRWPKELGYGSLHQEKNSLRIFWNGVGDGWRRLHEQALAFGERYHSKASEELWLAKTGRFNDIQISYIRKYGSPYVCEYYAPHITLARFQLQVDLSAIIVPEGLHGIQRIGLFELDAKYRTTREV